MNKTKQSSGEKHGQILQNKYLEENSIQGKVDHRSYQRQGMGTNTDHSLQAYPATQMERHNYQQKYQPGSQTSE